MRRPHRTEPAPDALDALRADHAAVLAGIDEVLASADRIGARARAAAADEACIRAFADRLEAQFATHIPAEDEAVYPALESALPGARQSLAPLRSEHRELRRMLECLRDTLREPPGRPRNEQVAVQVQDLADLLRIHIRKEEAVVFAVAERVLDRREWSALRARIAARLRPPVTPTQSRRAPRAAEGHDS